MKDRREIYRALADDKLIINKNGDVVSYNEATSYVFVYPEDWELYYPEIVNLIKAYKEGAVIEYYSSMFEKWKLTAHEPLWGKKCSYRIKGGISIESWNKWKDVILAYWSGKEIEFKRLFTGEGWKSSNAPTWEDTGWFDYRVKPEYAWQWIIKRDKNSIYDMTGFYTEEEINSRDYFFFEKYQPSKRKINDLY